MNQKTAIILGGTSLTGSLLLNRLIADNSYSSIKLFSGKASGKNSPKVNKIPTFLVMSSMGPKVKSKIFYSRTKGEMEQAVLDQAIPQTYILRPSLIPGERNEKRFGEGAGAIFLKLAHIILRGSLKKYRAIHSDRNAAAMISISKTLPDLQFVPSDVIREFCSNQ